MSEYTPKQWEINNMVTAKKIRELEEGEGHGSVTVDSALSDTSENPVQNKVITEALNAIKQPLVVTLTASGAVTYSADIAKSEVLAAFNAKRPVFVYEGDYMLQVIKATSEQITATTTITDMTADKLTLTVVAYKVTDTLWVKTSSVYGVDYEKPLILHATAMTETTYRLTNINASAINTAWNDNRNVELRLNGLKYELVKTNYTSSSVYHYVLQSSSVDATSGNLTVYTLDFVNSLTGTLYTREYEPAAEVS